MKTKPTVSNACAPAARTERKLSNAAKFAGRLRVGVRTLEAWQRRHLEACMCYEARTCVREWVRVRGSIMTARSWEEVRVRCLGFFFCTCHRTKRGDSGVAREAWRRPAAGSKGTKRRQLPHLVLPPTLPPWASEFSRDFPLHSGILVWLT